MPESPDRVALVTGTSSGIGDALARVLLPHTEVHVAARTSSPETLPSVAMFERFATERRLVPPSTPAAEIADCLGGDGRPRFSERRYGEPRSEWRSS